MSETPHSPGDVMSVGMASDARGTIVTPDVRDLVQVEQVLTQWLAPRLHARDLRLTDLTYPRGSGQSHETIMFDAHWREGGVKRAEGFVVRIKPSHFTVFYDDMFIEEYELMRILGERGTVPIAMVRWLEQDPAVLGSPFFVMERLHGHVAVSIPSYLESGWVAEASSAERARLWENCVRALASIQTMRVRDVEFLLGPAGSAGFAREWDRWERYLNRVDRADRPLPEYRDLLEHLRATIPSHQPEGIVWGDARIGNMLVDDFEVVALMDWEQPSLGGALHDLGWWLISERGKVAARKGGPLPGMLGHDETIQLWREITGISTEAIEWYEAFAAFKMGCVLVNLLDLRDRRPPGDDYAGMFHVRTARELLGM
ncbi:phosphotransferase family protein [Nonomuraea sp. NPDC005650]|uniref:phosphotransferase family protein n=1 Tax=Nonomuraea sp. NPDC005650 TaxID=3157045 RepID=UPI0033A8F295